MFRLIFKKTFSLFIDIEHVKGSTVKGQGNYDTTGGMGQVKPLTPTVVGLHYFYDSR